MKREFLPSSAWSGSRAAFLSLAATAIAAVLATSAAFAQSAQAPANGARPALPPVSTPIPEGDIAAVIKHMQLVESEKPAREIVKGWRKPQKILVYVDNNTNRIAWLQKVAPGVKLVAVHNQAEQAAQIADADGIIYGGCNKAVVESSKTLHWIQQRTAGTESCFNGDVPQKLMDGTVVVTNFKRVFGTPIADHAIAMMMALSRGLDLYAHQNQNGRFDRAAVPADRLWEIQGRTMLVVGLGGIGTEIARLGHALGMRVIATRETSHQGYDFVEYVGLSNELPDMIGKADVVMVASPLTAKTKNLFDAAMFARMKKGALFINIARPGEEVEDDLVAALKSGHLGGAGIEAEAGAAMSETDSLFTAPNALVTPHVAALAVDAGDADSGEETWQFVRENLRRYASGDKLLNVVNPKLGY